MLIWLDNLYVYYRLVLDVFLYGCSRILVTRTSPLTSNQVLFPLDLTPPNIEYSIDPDNSNCFSFPARIRVTGILLYDHLQRQKCPECPTIYNEGAGDGSWNCTHHVKISIV